MKIADYKSDCSRCQKSIAWRVMFAIFAMSSTLGIVPIARYYIPEWADVVAPIVVIAVALPLLVLAFAYADRAYRRYPTLVCSHCQGNLSRAQFVVIASGNCPHCGRRALIDPVIGT